MKKRLAVLISGRGSNMKAIAENVRDGILKSCCSIAVVVSNRPDAAGLETARDFGLETRCVPSKGKKRHEFETELIETIRPFHPDLIVLAGFMRILTPLFIGEFRGRIVNIHPADTRDFQGIGGYEWAWNQQLKETRITVHYIDDGVDTGPVISQKIVDLTGCKSLKDVENRGLKTERLFYSEVLEKLLTDKL